MPEADIKQSLMLFPTTRICEKNSTYVTKNKYKNRYGVESDLQSVLSNMIQLILYQINSNHKSTMNICD